jgi:hypothetical protein
MVEAILSFETSVLTRSTQRHIPHHVYVYPTKDNINLVGLHDLPTESCASSKTIILPVVLYGCETWALTVREEHKLRVFENRVLRRIFGPKRDGVTGGWRKLHNEELHNLYSSPSLIRIIKSRRMRWEGHVARMGEKRNVYRLLVGKPEGKRPQGRPRRRWIDNIKIDLSEIGVNVVDWIDLAQDRYRWRALVNSVMNLRVP